MWRERGDREEERGEEGEGVTHSVPLGAGARACVRVVLVTCDPQARGREREMRLRGPEGRKVRTCMYIARLEQYIVNVR